MKTPKFTPGPWSGNRYWTDYRGFLIRQCRDGFKVTLRLGTGIDPRSHKTLEDAKVTVDLYLKSKEVYHE